MGGGGAAAVKVMNKVVGIGVVNSGFRSKLPEHPVSAAVRVLKRPFSPITTTSKTDPVKPAVAMEPSDDTSSVQKTVSGYDDWDFADDIDSVSEDVISLCDDDGKVSPRFVFGGVPSLVEAKEATSELTQVLEKACLSSPVSPRSGTRLSSPVSSRFSSSLSSPVSPRFGGSDLSSPVSPRSGYGGGYVVTREVAEPRHAMQAFRILNECPQIQDVVASIASDPNVWNSMLNNPEFQHFLRSQKNVVPDHSAERRDESSSRTCESMPHTEDLDDDEESSSRTCESMPHTEDLDDDEDFGLEDVIIYYWKSTKVTVVDMMENLSGFFSNLFGGVLSTGKDSADTGFFEKALGPSVMGLVIMVIMMVFIKRPSS